VKIPLVDLKVNYKTISAEINQAISEQLSEASFINGKAVGDFEHNFAKYCGVKYSVGCANGMDAIELACRALDIGSGDEVIIPAMTFAATAYGVMLSGAKPVLVDVNLDDGLINTALIQKHINEKTKAIMPVHLYGQICNMDEISKIAKQYNLKIIEDAAQAHGANLNQKRAGSFGHVACFSFYPGKNLGAYGDAGGLTTDDPAIYEKLIYLRNCGSVKKYHHDLLGRNSRLDTLQAAILNVKLKYLDDWNALRRNHAKNYDLKLLPIKSVQSHKYLEGSVHHLYVIRVKERDKVLAFLNENGIGAGIHYPFALNELGALKNIYPDRENYCNAELWAREGLSLPIYPELPSDAPNHVSNLLKDYFNE
jgi:dTDP-4-amino-4,6-dideoxygalactose transaminase